MDKKKKIDILGVQVSLTNEEAIKKQIFSWLLDGKKHVIVTPNPEMVMAARRRPFLKKIINQADLAIPDGVGLVWASRFLYSKKKRIKKRISGVDLMEKICSWLSQNKGSVFFLGARPGVAEECARRLKARYPFFKVAGCFAGRAAAKNDKETRQHILSLLKKNGFSSSSVDILFVAYGAGRQEEWIKRNLPFLPVKIAMGVGGSFDFLSGRVKRAPLFLRKIGLEWLWRLIYQPWRWRRQLVLPVFVLAVIKEKIKRLRG